MASPLDRMIHKQSIARRRRAGPQGMSEQWHEAILSSPLAEIIGPEEVERRVRKRGYMKKKK